MCRSLWALGGRKKRQCLGLSGAAEKADLKSTACAMHMSAEGTVGTTYLIKFRETLAWGNPEHPTSCVYGEVPKSTRCLVH